MSSSLIVAILLSAEWHLVLIYVSLMTSAVEHPFAMCLLSFLIKCLFKSFAHLICIVFLLSCKSFLCILETSFIRHVFVNLFFQSVAYFFMILTVSSEEQKVSYFDEVQLINFFLVVHAFCVLFKSSSSTPRAQRVSSIFLMEIS